MNTPAGGARPESPDLVAGPAAAAGPLAGGTDDGRGHPTLWGLTPFELHDRFWASHGVQVVRPGDRRQPPFCAEPSLYLLLDADALALFEPPDVIARPPGFGLAYVHTSPRDAAHQERVITDADGRFVRFERLYPRRRRRGAARVAITSAPPAAEAWRSNGNWGAVRRAVAKSDRRTIARGGAVYDGSQTWDVAAFARELLTCWPDPSSAVGRAVRAATDGTWRDRDADVHPGARLVGPVWIGRGRHADAATMVVGPAVLWDDPAHRPAPEPFPGDLPRRLPPDRPTSALRSRGRRYLAVKRALDVVLSLVALAITLPLYPLIALAIAIEDGLPIFFAHRRETLDGREFPCLKFRSMRRNAEAAKAELRCRNRADGPQFFIEHDPRPTRVGRVLRRFRIDEWPQFFNVLAGHMSLVGPRPSPFAENQFCPAWRQTRLSVRPGITGLWQVSRTRAVGSDFQEWIRYDVEYVERASLWLDLRILAKTCVAVFRR
jgi:lipopolysaccharide/colanic/teichoic acid biosynthesis glycosyltransferase